MNIDIRLIIWDLDETFWKGTFGEGNVELISDNIDLIKKLNGGVVDSRFPIEWQHYRNSILLTNHGEFKQLNTKIYKIVEL